MDVWAAITSRRNVRAYAARSIESDELDRILEAGRRTPSSRNSQPWDFVVVADRARLIELAKVWQGAGHVAGSAATVGVVTAISDDARHREMVAFDLGQAVMQMMIAAAGMSIGSAHGWVVDQDQARRVLELPGDRELAWVVSFGYPVDRPLRPLRHPKRRPFDEVVHRETW
ncbi:MAG: nitroreductase family protein [Acidimicrobiia bacterium]|nr:nitroreductase family protein [Acidimicrobiia bacterium]